MSIKREGGVRHVKFNSCESKKGSIGELKERSDIDAKYKWDLTHLYKTMDDFERNNFV